MYDPDKFTPLQLVVNAETGLTFTFAEAVQRSEPPEQLRSWGDWNAAPPESFMGVSLLEQLREMVVEIAIEAAVEEASDGWYSAMNTVLYMIDSVQLLDETT